VIIISIRHLDDALHREKYLKRKERFPENLLLSNWVILLFRI